MLNPKDLEKCSIWCVRLLNFNKVITRLLLKFRDSIAATSPLGIFKALKDLFCFSKLLAPLSTPFWFLRWGFPRHQVPNNCRVNSAASWRTKLIIKQQNKQIFCTWTTRDWSLDRTQCFNYMQMVLFWQIQHIRSYCIGDNMSSAR